MLNKLGFSVYLSQFPLQKKRLSQYKNQNYCIFTSLHIPEEYSHHYQQNVVQMLQWLVDNGFYIIADVSLRTLEYLNVDSLKALVLNYPINNIRIDDGFKLDDLYSLPKSVDITINASTQKNFIFEWVQFRQHTGHKLYAMHNYYPRVETGLDKDDVLRLNQIYQQNDIEVIAFIVGDLEKRGPLFQGLPTLEIMRNQLPIIAFRTLMEWKVNNVFIGDGLISELQLKMIESYKQKNLILLPCQLKKEYAFLYYQDLFVRIDSPKKILRISQMRNRLLEKEKLKPSSTIERVKGSITMDNELYGRYAGEIHLVGKNLSSDERVNVIGKIPTEYMNIFNLENRGNYLQLIPLE